jgi:hypothetical protein
MSADTPEELVVLAQGSFEPLSEMREALVAAGIRAELARAPGEQQPGAPPQVVLVCASADKPMATQVLTAHWAGDSAEAVAAAGHVIDLDAEQATCPACMTSFPTDATRCPGCGLRLG